MCRTVKEFVNDDSAASALEYALVGSLIAIVLVSGLGAFGNTLGFLFNFVGSEVSNVTPAA